MGTRLLLVVTALTVSVAAGASAAPRQRGPRTLVRSPAPIASFAQDGSELAWVTNEPSKTCRRVLHFRAVRGGGAASLAIGCHHLGDLALAGRTALWKTIIGGGNLELVLAFDSAKAGDRRAHRVDSDVMEIDLDSGSLNPDPPLMGAGSLLAYYAEDVQAHELEVRRVVRGEPRTMFGFLRPLALAVDGRRVAVVRQALAGDGCGCTSSAAWSPDGRKVAFLDGVVNRNSIEPAELAVMNADGSGRAKITSDGLYRLDTGATLSGVDWSPDGTELAYTYWKSGGAGATIAVVHPDGTGAHDLASGRAPRWSPDGTKIAFTGPQGSGIWVMNADGSSVRQVTSGGSNPSWSPDGARLAYTDGAGLFVVNADGSGVRRVFTGGPTTATEPDWSPDGGRIAFAAQLAYSADGGIWVVNADGSGLRQLTAASDGAPRWSPDGSRILFTSAREDITHVERLRLELFTMAADGTDVQPLSFTQPTEWASVGEVHSAAGRLASFRAVGAPALASRFGSIAESRSVAIGGSRVAVLSVPAQTGQPRISLFDAGSGALQHVVQVPGAGPLELGGVSGQWVVFRTGRTIRLLNAVSLKTSVLTVRAIEPIGLSVSRSRVAWAENRRIMAVNLPR
jgi:Tol biopolymer transport system component